MKSRVRRRPFLQKLFPAFPTGWPGFGLLLLRGLVAFILIRQAAEFPGWLMPVVALTSAGFLLFGFMTPIVAAAIGLIAIGMGISNYEVIEIVILTAAIALLGPGAFSIDARMFGRREVLIPKRANDVTAATDRPDR